MATRSTAAHIDPVCGMPLDPSRLTASAEYAGDTHRFYSRGCKAEFDKSPDDFVESERAQTPGGDGRCGRQG